MLSIQKIFGHEGGRRERASDDCVTGTARATRIAAKPGTIHSRPAPDCRGHRPRLQFIQVFDYLLHAANYKGEPIVIELVGSVAG
jgi:hypothetical protein